MQYFDRLDLTKYLDMQGFCCGINQTASYTFHYMPASPRYVWIRRWVARLVLLPWNIHKLFAMWGCVLGNLVRKLHLKGLNLTTDYKTSDYQKLKSVIRNKQPSKSELKINPITPIAFYLKHRILLVAISKQCQALKRGAKTKHSILQARSVWNKD